MKRSSISANDVIVYGPVELVSGHNRLQGKIESLAIHVVDAKSSADIDVVVFRSATATDTMANCKYINHESFADTGFMKVHSATVVSQAKSGLDIPYIDTDNTMKFHFGIVSSITMSKGSVVLEWAWRPERGEF